MPLMLTDPIASVESFERSLKDVALSLAIVVVVVVAGMSRICFVERGEGIGYNLDQNSEKQGKVFCRLLDVPHDRK